MEDVIQCALELIQLFIDGDAKRLKHPGRGMLPGAPLSMRGQCRRDGFGEIGSRANRVFVAPRDQGAGNPPAERFFTVLVDDVGELRFMQHLQPLPGGSAAARVEAQIQRARGPKAESARFVGKLIGRQSQIEQHPIDRRNLQPIEDVLEFRIIGVNSVTVRAAQLSHGQAQHLRVSVETDQRSRGSDSFQNVLTVSGRSERAIDDDLAFPEIERANRFAKQHRHVDRFGFVVFFRSGRHALSGCNVT